MAVKIIRDQLLLLNGVTKDHKFAFIKVNFEARHGLKAEEQELKINIIPFRTLHHDHGVICILQVGDTTPGDQMSYHTGDVAGGLSPLQDLRQGVDNDIEEKGYRGLP